MRSLYLSLFALFAYSNCQSQTNHSCAFPYSNHQPEDQCGFVEVPRNWDTNSKATTKLGYLVIKSQSENRKEDPVIFLQGGPGGEVLSLANLYSQVNIDRDRDFILYDQRGIGFSEELCPDLNLELLKILKRDLNIKDEIRELKKSIQSCTQYINSDDRQFSTTTSVKDLEALRQHLGYKQFNLFGGSYGTRLGLKYMERYPNKVRTAVLSGLFSPDVRMYNNLFSNFNNSLEKVFADCAKNSACNAKYPDLKTLFVDLNETLKLNPIHININGDQFVLNQQDVLLFLHQHLYTTQTIERIPAFIQALKERNTEAISNTIYAFIPRLSIINLAVYYSVMTADEGGFNNQAMLKKDNENLILTDMAISLFSADPEVIKIWPIKKINSNPMHTVKSDIPTLLISGDFDPVTPPKNGDIVAKSLSQNQHFIFNNDGHVPVNGCFFRLAKQFLDNPTVKLDGSCAKTSTELDWD